MTGDLRHYRNTPEEPRHVRIRIDFTDGSHVAYDNMRKFGMVALIDDVGEFIQARRLGPDPLARGFGFETFKKALARKKGAAKAVLTDQATLAGIGNIYADEILFQTGIHPQQNISGLDERQVRELYRTTRRILQRAIAAGADADRMPSRWLLPNRERRGRCPRCGRALETMTVGGRTTYFCPGEQRRQG